MKKPSVISLFTGAGGLDLGIHAAGLGTAVAVEMDKHCCDTLRANKKRGYRWEVIERRVEDVPSAEILDASRLDVGEADLLIGGPPCQPFSKSGFWARGDSGRLRDPRANTLREYLRILEDTRPKAFLLENVAGLNFSGKEEGYQFILDEIARINTRIGTRYTVTSKVLNAAWYGIPQTRERIILVGSRDGTPFRYPDPTFHDPDGQATLFEVEGMHGPFNLRLKAKQETLVLLAARLPVRLYRIQEKVVRGVLESAFITHLCETAATVLFQGDLEQWEDVRLIFLTEAGDEKPGKIYGKVMAVHLAGDHNEAHLRFTSVSPEVAGVIQQAISGGSA